MKGTLVVCLWFPLVFGQIIVDPTFRPPTPPPLTTRRPIPSPLTFIGAKSITPGNEYELKVYITDRVTSDVNIRFELSERTSGKEEVIQSVSHFIPARATQTSTVTLRPRSSSSVYGYQLRITCDSVYCSSDPISLSANRQGASSEEIFVQMDKPKYKANDDVKFRAIIVDSDLKPSTGLYSVSIKDPKDNIIRKWDNQTLNKGVFGSSLQLSEDPILGDWKLMVKSVGKVNAVQYQKTFPVEEYVLPKFEVTMQDFPNFHIIGEGAMQTKIKAKYTHGGGVAGTAVITISEFSYYCNRRYRRSSPPYRPPQMCAGRNKTITQKTENGEIDLEITNAELISLISNCGSVCNENDLERKTFQVKVEYTEDFTNLNGSVTEKFEVRKNALNIRFAPFSPTNYRVGIHFNGFASVEREQGIPPTQGDLIDRTGRRSQLSVSYSTCTITCTDRGPNENCRENAARMFDIDESGLVPFDIPAIPKQYDSVKVEISFRDKYGNEMNEQTTIRPFCAGESETLKLSVDLPSGGIKEYSNLRFDVATTVNVNNIFYSMVADNEVVDSGSSQLPRPTRNGQFEIYITSELYRKMAPRAKIMAWAVTSGTFIADSVMVELDVKLPNPVTVQFNTAESSPGSTITLSVRANPDSLVGILGVDRSVQLLGTGNDITQQDVKQRIGNGGNFPGPMPRFGGPVNLVLCRHCGYQQVSGSNIPELLSQTGLFVSSTADQCNERAKICPYYYYPYPEASFPGPPGVGGFPRGQPGPSGPPGAPPPMPAPAPPRMPTVDRESGPAPLLPVTKIRTLFPETWLWMEEETGSGGQKFLTATLPDTITSWSASAWAINTRDGLGVADPALVKSVKPFFVTLTLPYSIVRGEEFLLKASVFNYMPNEQEVHVTLGRSDDFTTLVNGIETTQDVRRTIRIPTGQARGASFWIKPNKLGQVDIEVRAQSQQSADALRRKLLVKPEGTEESVVQSRFIALSPSNSFFSTTFNLNYPSNTVRGSEKVKLSVSGTVMGPVTENVGRHANKPYGCGEQNMINFVPNILVMKYLTATGTQNDALKEKALGFIKTGYQREMNYLRKDGGYAAFGDRSKVASTWLTGYVIKSYAEAYNFIGDIIDEDSVVRSVNFLLTQQNKAGEFQENYRSGNTFLKGGSSSEVSMTAYMTLALTTLKNEMPIPEIQRRVNNAIDLSVAYLRGKFPAITDPYKAAIVGYTLAVNGQSGLVNAVRKKKKVPTATLR